MKSFYEENAFMGGWQLHKMYVTLTTILRIYWEKRQLWTILWKKYNRYGLVVDPAVGGLFIHLVEENVSFLGRGKREFLSCNRPLEAIKGPLVTEIWTIAMWNSCGWTTRTFIEVFRKIKQSFTQKRPQQRWMEHQVYLASSRRDQAQWIWFSFDMLILNDTIFQKSLWIGT